MGAPYLITRNRRRRLAVMGGQDFAQFVRSNGDLLLDYDLQELSGLVAHAYNVAVPGDGILASSAYPGAELLPTAGTGRMDKVNWTESHLGVLSNPDGETLRATRDGVNNNPFGTQAVVTTIGERTLCQGWLRSDGNSTPRIAETGVVLLDGTTSTDKQYFEFEYIPVSTVTTCQAVTSTGNEFAEFNVSFKPANPLNGDITGAVLGVPTGLPLGYAMTFDGATSFIDIYSAELNSMFDPTKGSIVCYAKVANAGVWTDGAVRRVFYLSVDADNRIYLQRSTVNNVLQASYEGQATAAVVSISPITTLDMFMITLTWSIADDEFKVYLNDVLINTINSLDVIIGNLDPTRAVIGAGSTVPANVWHGDISQTIKYYSEALSPSYIAELSRRAGTS